MCRFLCVLAALMSLQHVRAAAPDSHWTHQEPACSGGAPLEARCSGGLMTPLDTRFSDGQGASATALAGGSTAKRILLLTPFGSRSVRMQFSALAEALVQRGHHVTILSRYAIASLV